MSDAVTDLATFGRLFLEDFGTFAADHKEPLSVYMLLVALAAGAYSIARFYSMRAMAIDNEVRDLRMALNNQRMKDMSAALAANADNATASARQLSFHMPQPSVPQTSAPQPSAPPPSTRAFDAPPSTAPPFSPTAPERPEHKSWSTRVAEACARPVRRKLGLNFSGRVSRSQTEERILQRLQTIHGTIVENDRRNAWVSFVFNVLFFAAGLIAPFVLRSLGYPM